MILATDVHYTGTSATAAGVLFAHWHDCEPAQEVITHLSGVADYKPGEFYRRELPCLLALLSQINPLPQIIVIDGYVHLGKMQQPGLGKHLYAALAGQAAVIGVAKNRYRGTPATTELRRGTSQRPLFITAVGIDLEEARRCIQQMCGQHRLPHLLKRVDRLCRETPT